MFKNLHLGPTAFTNHFLKIMTTNTFIYDYWPVPSSSELRLLGIICIDLFNRSQEKWNYCGFLWQNYDKWELRKLWGKSFLMWVILITKNDGILNKTCLSIMHFLSIAKNDPSASFSNYIWQEHTSTSQTASWQLWGFNQCTMYILLMLK